MRRLFAGLLGSLLLVVVTASGQQESAPEQGDHPDNAARQGSPTPTQHTVTVVSSSYGSGEGGGLLVGPGDFYVAIVADEQNLYMLSCTRSWSWSSCPTLVPGERYLFSKNPKNNEVELRADKKAKPIRLHLDKADPLPTKANNKGTPTADLAEAPISDSGNAFLAQCDTGGDSIAKAGCKVWVDGFMNGLMVGMAAATPGESEFDPEKNDIVCLTKTATFGQVFPLILKYIRDHPEERKDPTAALAFSALQEAFPCKH
ncbi:MAG: Rap1a/Tai family immunity protein [Terriglobales bacterium]